MAQQSTFHYQELEETARAMLGFGMAAKEVPAALQIVTDQVTAMGGSIENVNAIVRIFGRVMDKDFVGAMDLFRLLPANGIKVMEALEAAVGKTLNIGKATHEQVMQAMKDGVLVPAETINVILRAMQEQTRGAGASVNDAAKAFKNLGDTLAEVKRLLAGDDGFGPSIAKLATDSSTPSMYSRALCGI